MPFRRTAAPLFLAVPLLLAPWAARAQEGISVDQPSTLRNLVPAQEIEQSANQQYHALLQQAAAKHALAPDDNPQLKRLRSIVKRLIANAPRYNPRATEWHWEVNLIGSKQINAFCMPGGKIAFYTGLVEGMKLSDDEVAIVMGHEMAHALREHAREQTAKSELTQIGASILGQFIGRGQYNSLFQQGGNLLTLKFSRDDESEADLVGLDLAARSGFDPRAGVALWHKMAAQNTSRAGGSLWSKMASDSIGGAIMGVTSTHPADENRIAAIEQHLPEVMPLYEQSRSKR